mmetsp:Transcript_17910/g.27666  ORF Transcript_17910/g.27666 Transcript_17910/m.27666 type:complete len:224 (+) Transcript_17910:102-773(+)
MKHGFSILITVSRPHFPVPPGMLMPSSLLTRSGRPKVSRPTMLRIITNVYLMLTLFAPKTPRKQSATTILKPYLMPTLPWMLPKKLSATTLLQSITIVVPTLTRIVSRTRTSWMAPKNMSTSVLLPGDGFGNITCTSVAPMKTPTPSRMKPFWVTMSALLGKAAQRPLRDPWLAMIFATLPKICRIIWGPIGLAPPLHQTCPVSSPDPGPMHPPILRRRLPQP